MLTKPINTVVVAYTAGKREIAAKVNFKENLKLAVEVHQSFVLPSGYGDLCKLCLTNKNAKLKKIVKHEAQKCLNKA